MLRDSVLERVLSGHMGNGAIGKYAEEIVARQRDPYSLVEEIVNTWEMETDV